MNQYFINKVEVHRNDFHKMLNKNINQFENELKFEGQDESAKQMRSVIMSGLLDTGSVTIYDCKFQVISTTMAFEN